MNCMEFRRILLTDPGVVDPEFSDHRRRCLACADAVARSAHFERRLREAVNVDVPENLASNILLKQSFQANVEPPWWRRRRFYALAASIFLALGLTFMGLDAHFQQRRLSEEFVALINGAPYALTTTRPVSSSEISAALEPAGLDLQGDIGDVTFAGPCIVRGKLSGHIVVQGDTAPVTVFLIREQLVAGRATIRSDHYSGIVLAQGTGTIAIVGSPGEALDKVEARVRSAIRWARMQGA
jgi:hypothetical protein